ncbi:family 43 glycosylhydrolase [Sphingobacterium oryzagri]|uniref:Family 43 glycosylhydrolase n=1 Tax=Sphingobacterium oryzagri TaxID=3025669 RepID=A0ABY7WDE3_9SPHI|nr:family 43 glycosylhydrolase [Sphingobacterium sp. KACC 22765]WDF67517.1 family 43 glycosylhydrolase [Sphingobacterium sp. KACC 22765]
MKSLISIVLLFFLWASALRAQQLGKVVVHDPVLIKQHDTYYVFATGQGIDVWSSPDLLHWTKQAPVFASPPSWAKEIVPTFRGHIWAPDITYYRGQYYLYYSVSSFGKNKSAIGLCTNVTLDEKALEFKWVDHGLILQSTPGKTAWNAIDPNFICAENGDPYLAFGSFWDGLKMVKLRIDGLQTADTAAILPTIATRLTGNEAQQPNPIEAPFIYRHSNGFFYLFASIDYCCKGINSSYKIIVGRSQTILGPYLDDMGNRLDAGGGKLLLQGDARWHGVGHNAVVNLDSETYLIFHGYDAKAAGKPKLRIEKLDWDAVGWPQVSKTHLTL